jgi:hypothetical protein
MKKITPVDVPEDMIEELAEAMKTDTATLADLIVYLGNEMMYRYERRRHRPVGNWGNSPVARNAVLRLEGKKGEK